MADKYLKKFRRCILEYTNIADAYNISEEDNDEMAQDDMAPNQNIPQDTNQDEMGFGMQNNEMGTPVDNTSIGDANNGVEGFNPEGTDETTPMDGMGSIDDNIDTMQPEDEVIDVDDLTKSQETTEKKIDAMTSKFEKLMGTVEVLIKQNAERDAKAAKAEAQLKAELEKRIPTPQQRMTMRSTKSSPYSMTPNEYMNNYAPENYSDEDDNNGADDAQYQITKDDIDRFTDYNTIAKELDINHQSLKDILGF